RPLALVNVIGHFGAPGGRQIALCAHYDTRPWCDQDPDSAHRADPLPGANDAGSGVAVLLEVAELMARQAPSVAVDLVFFDGGAQGRADHPEEFLLGARGYARRASEPKATAAFLFDMVGDRDLDIHPEQRSAEQAANLVAMVLDGARATGARGFFSAPPYPLTHDHVPPPDAGRPCVGILGFHHPPRPTHPHPPDHGP